MNNLDILNHFQMLEKQTLLLNRACLVLKANNIPRPVRASASEYRWHVSSSTAGHDGTQGQHHSRNVFSGKHQINHSAICISVSKPINMGLLEVTVLQAHAFACLVPCQQLSWWSSWVGKRRPTPTQELWPQVPKITIDSLGEQWSVNGPEHSA